MRNLLAALLLVPLAAAQSQKLNPPLALDPGLVGADVDTVRYSPDGSRAVYLTRGSPPPQLFSVPADGSAPAVRLSADLPAVFGPFPPSFEIASTSAFLAYSTNTRMLLGIALDGSSMALLNQGVLQYRVTPDGARVIQILDTGTAFEVQSSPINGIGPIRVLATHPRTSVPFGLALSADGQRAVYVADSARVFSVPLDGSAPALELGHGESGVSSVGISPDSSRVVFGALGSFEHHLLSVPLDGSAPPVALEPDSLNGFTFSFSPDGARVVFSEWGSDFVLLYSVPTDGSAPATRLNPGGGLALSGQQYQVTPDGARVVYRDDRVLYAVPIAGGPSEVLSGTLTPGGGVVDFQIPSDSLGVVFRADKNTDEVFELFAVPFGGSSFPLSGPMVPGGDVSAFAISPDHLNVVYRADRIADGVDELYSVPITGGTSRRLSVAPVSGGDVTSFAIAPGSGAVAYVADQEVDQLFELYRAPILGGAAPAKLSAPLDPGPTMGDVAERRITPDGHTVLYVADQEEDDVFRLYAVPIQGGTAVALSDSLTRSNQFLLQPRVDWDLARDGARAVYLSDVDTPTSPELFSVRTDGSEPARKLSLPVAPSGSIHGVHGFRLTPDGTRVVYVAYRNGAFADLFVVPTDGSAPAVQLNAVGQSVAGIIADSGVLFQVNDERVVYHLDQLFSAPLDGSAHAAPIDPNFDHPVLDSAIAPDGRSVVCIASTSDGFHPDYQLFRVLFEEHALGRRVVNLSGPMVLAGNVQSFQISPDARRVVYLADQEVDQRVELFSTTIDGARNLRGADGRFGERRRKLNAPLGSGQSILGTPVFTPDGATLLFVQGTPQVNRLYAARLDTSAPLRELAQNVAPALVLAPDGSAVLVRDQANLRLYLVPTDGSQAPLQLDVPLVSGYEVSHVFDASFRPDGAWVLYSADERTLGVSELFARPLDASLAPQVLNGPLQPAGDVGAVNPFGPTSAWVVAPDSTRVVYGADQDSDNVYELYSSPLP